VSDGEPGKELHIDTGWMTLLEPDEHGKRRRFRAWIFTPHVSRYRFVYPCWKESTESAIEACEAAWEFYGGVFGVVVPDCTRAIVHTADPRKPRIVDGFLEYAQSRDFHVDPTRPRHPKDKARTERAVRDVRDDCFAGEKLIDLADARRRGRHWCLDEYECAIRRRSECRVSTSTPRRNRCSRPRRPSSTTLPSGASRVSAPINTHKSRAVSTHRRSIGAQAGALAPIDRRSILRPGLA
jgi:hypothetical protein